MSEPAELNDRVTRLEKEVREARQDAAAARILAGGADRDVSEMRAELRAHTGTLEALRKTQVEQGRVLAGHGNRIDGLDRRVARLEAKVDTGFAEMSREMDSRFTEVDRRFGEMGREMDSRFGEIEREMRRGFALLGQGQQKITELLTSATETETDET